MRQYGTVFLFLIVSTFALGCGSKVGLHGQVVFSDDNTPLKQGIVIFQKDGTIARGQIDQNGNYTVGSSSVSDGLPPGTYQVSLSGTAEHKGMQDGEDLFKEVVDPKYGRPETSGLTVTVDRSQKFNISVDRYKE